MDVERNANTRQKSFYNMIVESKRHLDCEPAQQLAMVALSVYVFMQLLLRYSLLSSSLVGIDFSFAYMLADRLPIALALFSIVMRARTKPAPKWLSVLAFVTFGPLFLSAELTGDYRLLFGSLILLALVGGDPDMSLRHYAIAAIMATLVLVILALLHVAVNRDVVPNARLVFSYGYGHPNSLGAVLFSITGALTYLTWEKKGWTLSLVMAGTASMFSYVVLSSHAPAAMLAFLFFATLLGHVFPIRKTIRLPRKTLQVLTLVLPLCLAAVMAVCTVRYNAESPAFSLLNKLLHGRPFYSNSYYLTSGGLSLFGRNLVPTNWYHTGVGFQQVDSGYSYFILVYGLTTFFSSFLLYGKSVLGLEAKSGRQCFLFLVILVEAAYLLVECHSLYLPGNFALLFLAMAFEI